MLITNRNSSFYKAILLITLALFSYAIHAAPDVIAHRGASAYLPEHSLAAVSLAHAMGANFIEQDIVLTRDNHAIVFHDVYLDGVTDVTEKFPTRTREDGRHYAIDFDLAEIKTLSIKQRRRRNGEYLFPDRPNFDDLEFRIPTLEEEIELINTLNNAYKTTCGLYLEIKAPAWHRQHGKDISTIVLNTLKNYGYPSFTKPAYIQSFSAQELQRIHFELAPEFRLIQLIGDNRWGETDTDFERIKTDEGLKNTRQYAYGIGVWIRHAVPAKDRNNHLVSSGLVRRAKTHKLAVHTYTLRNDALPHYAQNIALLINELFAQGVDGIITDFPDTTRAYIHNHLIN